MKRPNNEIEEQRDIYSGEQNEEVRAEIEDLINQPVAEKNEATAFDIYAPLKETWHKGNRTEQEILKESSESQVLASEMSDGIKRHFVISHAGHRRGRARHGALRVLNGRRIF